MNQENKSNLGDQGKMPPAETGNASNPSPASGQDLPKNQLLNERAEKYLRESASPEDYPDEQDWEDADKTLKDKGTDQA